MADTGSSVIKDPHTSPPAPPEKGKCMFIKKSSVQARRRRVEKVEGEFLFFLLVFLVFIFFPRLSHSLFLCLTISLSLYFINHHLYYHYYSKLFSFTHSYTHSLSSPSPNVFYRSLFLLHASDCLLYVLFGQCPSPSLFFLYCLR